MNINRNNYELFFIDYLEGNLSEQDLFVLKKFLTDNPDLADELNSLDSFTAEPEHIVFKHKQSLKKNTIPPINNQNFDSMAIAYLENDLSDTEKLEFEQYIKQNPKKGEEYSLFEKTKIQPDFSIKYPDKKQILHRNKTITRQLISFTAIAASFLLLFSVLIKFMSQNESTDNEIAKRILSKHLAAIDTPEKILPDTGIIQKKDSINNKQSIAVYQNITQKKESVQKTEPTVNIAPPEAEFISKKNQICTIPMVSSEVIMKKQLLPSPENKIAQERQRPIKKLGRFIAGGIKKHIFHKKPEENIELFDIAEVGINGLRKITETDLHLVRSFNDNGKVSKITLSASNFQYVLKKD